MLEQHPVPQNVTSFQFRLIGDMTLKQFGYLAGGAILAYIAYHLPLPFFFTWPLTAILALGGIGFAFVPVEERPMDVWFMSFIKSIYSPTLYIWQRDTPSSTDPKQGLQSFIPPLPVPDFLYKLQIPSKKVQQQAAAVQLDTTQASVWQNSLQQKKAQTPNHSSIHMDTQTSTTTHTNGTVPSTQQTPAPESSVLKPQLVPSPPPLPTTPVVQTPVPVEPPQQESPEAAQKETESSPAPDLQKQLQDALNDKKRLEQELASIRQMLQNQQQPAPPVTIPGEIKKPAPVYFRSYPNVITGTVRQQTGELLNSILVTVKDKDEVPLRALKTNKTGQFAASTPLPNGTYTLDVEDPKGMFFFQPVTMTLTGGTLEPIVILAKTKQDLERQKLQDALFGKQQ